MLCNHPHQRLNPLYHVCLSTLLESSWANSSQRKLSLSLRTPLRSTPTILPPMDSSTSSRRTLPESHHLYQHPLYSATSSISSAHELHGQEHWQRQLATPTQSELKHPVCFALIVDNTSTVLSFLCLLVHHCQGKSFLYQSVMEDKLKMLPLSFLCHKNYFLK